MHDDVIQLIERCRVPFPKAGSGVSQAAVSDAEAALGIPFPESYKWWLLNYGGGQIKGDIVYGLHDGDIGKPDIVELARMNEHDGLYGDGRLVFSVGNGENFFFDTTKMEHGEYRVVMHDIAQEDLIPYARSFEEFLCKRIRELYGVV
jgi:hypothetical protein